MAAEGSSNPLVAFSAALAALVATATPRAVGIRVKGAPPLTGTLWPPDVVVASEQVFPDVGETEILYPDGALSPARVAGRDPGTNVVALLLDPPVEIAPPASAEPSHGSLALSCRQDRVVRGRGSALSAASGRHGSVGLAARSTIISGST